MAIKTIDLVINTSRGEQNVKKLHQLAKQVEKTFGNLNKLKINIKTESAKKKLSALEKEINKGNRKINAFLKTANPGMRFFGNSIGTARDNLAAVRKAFDDATSASARQNGATALLAGNFRKLRMEAVAFAQASGADPSKTIGNVSARIKEIQGFPRTIMAGNEAMTLLKRMQDMTIAGSKEFLLVSKAIGEQLKVNATIQMQASRAAKPMTASTAFVSQEQLQALGRNKLVPPSMRLPAAGESSGKFVEIQSKPIEKAVKNIQKSSNKTANILTQQSAFGMLPPIGGTTSPINARFSRANLGFGKNANPQGLFAMPGGAVGRVKGGVGSALIGGGFPALFGAGGVSSAFGAIAGGVGGALAPGGGFAASIIATAAAAEIEKTMAFRKEVEKLNKEIILSGASSEFTRQAIKKLAKDLDITKEEAVKLASEFSEFGGETGEALIRAFSSKEIFNSLSGLRTTESVLSKISDLRKTIGEDSREEALQILATKGSLEAQLFLEKRILDRNREAVRLKAEKITFADRREFLAEGMTGQDIKRFIANRVKTELEAFDKLNEKQLKVLENQIKINEQMQFITEFQAPTEEIRELLNPMRAVLDLSTSIRTGFEESFKGIIKGTMSVQDAFRNMLGRIADHFLDTAARLAAAQLQKGFLSLFTNLFSFNSFTRDPISATPTLTPEQQVSRFTFARANGGTVRRGQPYIVGERGAEMFIPDAGGRIIANHNLGGMGGTNIVVNVDASGSNVEGDEAQGRELGRLISVAIQSELIKQKRPGGMLA